MNQPAWLAGDPQPADAVAEQPVAEAPLDVKQHAYWFAWARQYEPDVSRCHLAAHAAAAAIAGGADAAGAGQAAQQAAMSSQPGAPTGVPQYTQAYSAFYAWALNELHIDPDRSHRIAHAATHATTQGVPAAQAADVGLQAVGLKRGNSPSVPYLRDAAVRSTILGGVCLLVVAATPSYFIFLPILGVIYALRSLNTARFYFAIAGLGLNGMAIVLACFKLFHISV